MTSNVFHKSKKNTLPSKASWWQKSCYKLMCRQLEHIDNGMIELHSPIGNRIFGDTQADLKVVMTVTDNSTFERFVTGGSVGAAEAYMEGHWYCSDLTGLVRILVRNRHILDDVESGVARFASWAMKAWHKKNRNTRAGSRKNIAAHYDLGNDLFQLFLDQEWMMYSSALYRSDQDSLEQAQTQKLHALCEKLDLQATDHLLEIGTGWGGCAIFAAKHYGCRVTTTTISKEQYEYAKARVKAEGLEDRIELLLKDYRDLTGHYDKLVSIEMVEAVGHQFVDEYFKTCAARLKPEGLAAIQAITIEDHRYQQAVKSVDFIKRFIFPGSFIPCVSVLTQSAAQANLRLVNLEDIGDSYAKTLNEWQRRFTDKRAEVYGLGYDQRFIRMWEFYLSYCEGGFIERSISDVHLLFAAENNKTPNYPSQRTLTAQTN